MKMSGETEESAAIQQYFKLIQDPTRRDILNSISDAGEASFSEIRDKLGFTAEKGSKLSYHLQQLEAMKLVEKNEDDRYEMTFLGQELLSYIQMIEGTIRTGTVVGKWIEDINRNYGRPPLYMAEIHGTISVQEDRFDSSILVTRMSSLFRSLGIPVETSRYTEKDEEGRLKSGWFVQLFSYHTQKEESQYPESGIRIFDDGTFYVASYLQDTARMYPYYDYEKHKRLLDQGSICTPFFFAQNVAYEHVLNLYLSAHLLWGRLFEVELTPPKSKYMWMTDKENEVPVEPIWIDELETISWNKMERDQNARRSR